MHQDAVLHFWFNETSPEQWWVADAAFDTLIAQRFKDLHQKAIQCELSAWRQTAKGRLAEIIILDQFSRNIYRDTAQAFAQDGMALILSQEAVAAGADQSLTSPERSFLFLPYMHSESKVIHVQAEILYRTNGLQENYAFELKHKAIIDRFNRYPHRNKALGRTSTPAEIEFLKQPGSHF